MLSRGEFMKREAINIRFPKELKEKLMVACAKKSINMSDWFRQRAEEFIKECEK